MTPIANGYGDELDPNQAKSHDHKQHLGLQSLIPILLSTVSPDSTLSSSSAGAAEQSLISFKKPFREPEPTHVLRYLKEQIYCYDLVEDEMKILVTECTARLRDIYKANPWMDEPGEFEQASPLGSVVSDSELDPVGDRPSAAEAIATNDDHTAFEGDNYHYIDKDYISKKAVGADRAAAGLL